MSHSEKIDSCKRIVLWMLKDRQDRNLLELTTKEILKSFTTSEKRKRILQALNELWQSGDIMKINGDKDRWFLKPIPIKKEVC